jgi:hypothetical protein
MKVVGGKDNAVEIRKIHHGSAFERIKSDLVSLQREPFLLRGVSSGNCDFISKELK